MLPSTLDALADLSEIRGAAAEAAGMRATAGSIRRMSPADQAAFTRRARRGRLEEEAAIDPGVQWRVRELVAGGPDAAVAAARAGIPWLLRRLLELVAITPSDALLLVQQLGIVTLPDLVATLHDGRLAQQRSAAVVTRLKAAALALGQEVRLVPLGRATELLDAVCAAIERGCPSIDLLTPAGDARRFESLVSSLVIVGRASDPQAAIEAVSSLGGLEDVRHRGGRRAVVVFQQTEIDIRVAAPDDYGTVLFNATGSTSHLRAVHERRGRARLAPGEEAVYADAGLPFIPPELREGAGEIEAAAAGRLPGLVQREHIRGDLHMHTTRSDGADTLDAMVAESAALGYEYIAITDHSERAAAGRTLGRGDLDRQRSEIAALQDRYPRLRILRGIEVDIMPDGRLDFDDRLLEPLDIVLASLHDSAGHDPAALTRRCLAAIRHPLVNVITHPANRLVGRRAGYALDFDAVYAAAAETGTALEVDGAPSHLDLDGEHARRAVAAGVTLTIDSDCHRARSLQRQMALGIGTARRGWVEPRHVLNARPLRDVLAFVAAKRRR